VPLSDGPPTITGMLLVGWCHRHRPLAILGQVVLAATVEASRWVLAGGYAVTGRQAVEALAIGGLEAVPWAGCPGSLPPTGVRLLRRPLGQHLLLALPVRRGGMVVLAEPEVHRPPLRCRLPGAKPLVRHEPR
jgi:hypothetical protein